MDKTKLTLPEELLYILGLLFMAYGVAFVSYSNLGYSMITAPVYLLYKTFSTWIPFLSFGMMEYIFQGFLILLLSLILRQFKWSYLFSFGTAFLYGNLFNLALFTLEHIPVDTFALRILWFFIGEVLIVLAVVFFMHTYLPPEAYELVVKEVTFKTKGDLGVVKLIYDTASLVLSLILALCLFGGGVFVDFTWEALGQAILDGYLLEGIGIGTLVGTFINGPLISLFNKLLCKHFEIRPGLPKLHSFFTSY